MAVGDEECDAGSVQSDGVGWRGLGEDDAGSRGCRKMCDGAEFELEAAENEGGWTLGLAGEVRHGYFLAAEGLSDANLPASADMRASGGGL